MATLLRPLNPETIRTFPPCRTLSYYRRNLGHGARLATRWVEFNQPGGVNLAQSQFAAIANLIATEQVGVELDLIERATHWIVASSKRRRFADPSGISRLESRNLPLTKSRQRVINCVFALTNYSASDLSKFRSGLKLSQTRFATLCLIAQMPITKAEQVELSQAIVQGNYSCPQAGDSTHVSHIECGFKEPSPNGRQAFCNTFSFLFGRVVLQEELFDDYLEEIGFEQR